MVGGPRPPPGVQLSMPAVVPIEPYEELSSCRYGGPYKRPKEIKDAQKVIGEKASDPFLEKVPAEIVYEIINNLSSKDLKNVAVCNRALNEIVTPILYKRSAISTIKALFILEDDLPNEYARNVFLDPEKNKEANKRFEDFLTTLPTGGRAGLVKTLECLGIDSRSWQFGHELLRRLPNLEDTSLTWLSCHREFVYQSRPRFAKEPKDKDGVQLDSEEQRVDRLISEFGETTMKNLTRVSFSWSSIKNFVKVLSHLPKLEKLYTHIPDPTDPQSLEEDVKKMIPAISITVGSTLVSLDIGREPAIKHIDAFIKPLGDRPKFPSLKNFNVTRLPSTLDDKDLRIGRARFLYETCRASKRHGQWTFPHKHLRVSVLEMAVLEAEQIKMLYLWLCKNIPKWDGEVLLEEFSVLRPTEAVPALEGFLHKMDKISNDVPLKLCIDSTYPPTSKNRFLNVIKKFALRLVQLTVTPAEIDPGEEDDEEYLSSLAETAFMQWTDFLETFLPLCKNMHTFRTISQPGGGGADILLMGKLESKIAKLCRENKLRHFDIDLSSLLQPETPAGIMLFNGEEQPGDGPRRVIQGIAWISTQRGTMMKPDFRNCLQNLTTLKMRSLFIFRQVEMIWFTNLPAKLKNLELIEVHGLVWHIGYESGFTDSEDEEDGKGRDGEDEWEDLESETNEIPSLEVGEQIGKLGLAARLDADSSLLAWLPEDPDSDSDSEPEEKDDRGKRPKELGDDDDNDDDGEDALSTDSGFGSDPRFTKDVNDQLHVARLKQWICRVLIATAKKTGGRCRKVFIRHLVINGKGLDPWALEDYVSGYSDFCDDEDSW